MKLDPRAAGERVRQRLVYSVRKIRSSQPFKPIIVRGLPAGGRGKCVCIRLASERFDAVRASLPAEAGTTTFASR